MSERKALYILKQFTYMHYAELIFLKLGGKKYVIVIELFARYGVVQACTQEEKCQVSRVSRALGHLWSHRKPSQPSLQEPASQKPQHTHTTTTNSNHNGDRIVKETVTSSL